MIDIHCHLLPGIDDGPKTWDDSLALCHAMSANGIRTAVATPHLIDGIYNNVRSKIEPMVRDLNVRVKNEGITLEILAGAEIDLSSRHIASSSPDLPRLGGGNAVLLEMPMAVLPHAMDSILFGVRAQGLVPVLAHPERNELLQDDIDLAQGWIDAGALLQIDGDSLLGVWGSGAKYCAERLLSERLCHAMASDAHSVDRRPPRLRESLAAARVIVGPGVDVMVGAVARAILRGTTVPTPAYAVQDGLDEAESTRRRKEGRGGWLGRIFGRSAE